jgi:meso-butanediol dehydrogenase/(S,S)-butanediol dehydrogenase/diacetyl reductase
MKRSKKSIPSQERVLPSMHVSGKTALVTGAGSGLGRSIALALAEAGADVAVTELPSRLENARAVATSIRSMGREALVVKLDVSSVKSI